MHPPAPPTAPGTLPAPHGRLQSESPVGFYDDPLVYDILHARGTADDVRGLARIQLLYGKAPPRLAWLEPACGSGRYLLVAGANRPVIGFDQSPAMIAYAHEAFAKKGLSHRVHLFVADMGDFADHLVPHPVALAFNLINSIRHLSSDAEMLRHFEHVARTLAPGAIYVVGLSLSAYGIEPPTEDIWEGSRGSIHVHQAVQYEPPPGTPGKKARAVAMGETSRTERVYSHLTITRTRAGTPEVEHRDSTYALRCYNFAQWQTLIDRSPFQILRTCDERGRPIPPAEPGYCLFVLGVRSPPPPSDPP